MARLDLVFARPKAETATARLAEDGRMVLTSLTEVPLCGTMSTNTVPMLPWVPTNTSDDERGAAMLRESLYATPSFLAGVARILDFWGYFDRYNTSPTEREADIRAIGSDWRAVGEDLRMAIREYESLNPPAVQLDLFAAR